MKEESHIVGYFQFDAEEFSVAIVLKDFWDKNQTLQDSYGKTYVVLEQSLPKGFYELTDSIFEHDYPSPEEAKEKLIKSGFVKKKIFDL